MAVPLEHFLHSPYLTEESAFEKICLDWGFFFLFHNVFVAVVLKHHSYYFSGACQCSCSCQGSFHQTVIFILSILFFVFP